MIFAAGEFVVPIAVETADGDVVAAMLGGGGVAYLDDPFEPKFDEGKSGFELFWFESLTRSMGRASISLISLSLSLSTELAVSGC